MGEGTEVDAVSDEQQTSPQPEWERTPLWQQVAVNTGRRSTFCKPSGDNARDSERRWNGVKP